MTSSPLIHTESCIFRMHGDTCTVHAMCVCMHVCVGKGQCRQAINILMEQRKS